MSTCGPGWGRGGRRVLYSRITVSLHRFHNDVQSSLSVTNLTVTEIRPRLSRKMREIQMAIMTVMEACLQELIKCNPGVKTYCRVQQPIGYLLTRLTWTPSPWISPCSGPSMPLSIFTLGRHPRPRQAQRRSSSYETSSYSEPCFREPTDYKFVFCNSQRSLLDI
jgi:hypothetical protein